MIKHKLHDICEDYKAGMSFEKICKKYGGFQIYIPQVIPNVQEKILKEFNGYNYELLATRYNISLRKVQQIIKEHKENKEDKEVRENKKLINKEKQ